MGGLTVKSSLAQDSAHLLDRLPSDGKSPAPAPDRADAYSCAVLGAWWPKVSFGSGRLPRTIVHPVADYINVRRTIGWLNRKDGDESFCPGYLMRMTRLALCGQPSQKDRQVSSLVIRETGKNAQKVRIGCLPDVVVQDLGAAATTASANAPPV